MTDPDRQRAAAHYTEQARLATAAATEAAAITDPEPETPSAPSADDSPAALRLRRWMYASAAPQLEAITDPVRECDLLLRVARISARLLDERRALPYFERVSAAHIGHSSLITTIDERAALRREINARALRNARIEDLERDLSRVLSELRSSIDIGLYLDLEG